MTLPTNLTPGDRFVRTPSTIQYPPVTPSLPHAGSSSSSLTRRDSLIDEPKTLQVSVEQEALTSDQKSSPPATNSEAEPSNVAATGTEKGGKEGEEATGSPAVSSAKFVATPFPPFRPEPTGDENLRTSAAPEWTKGKGDYQSPPNEDFISAMFQECPPGSMPAICSIPGDPTNAKWLAFPAEEVTHRCPDTNNNYFNCSTFRPLDQKLAARKDQFAAYHVLVLDDVGTKSIGALPDTIQPTWRLETSPGNCQVGFLICPPIEDPAQVAVLQRAVFDAELGDPGADGVARWMRLPNGINGKAKHQDNDGNPFKCRIQEYEPDRRYSFDELVAGLGLTLAPKVMARLSPVGPKKTLRLDDDVCTFQRDENPVLTALKEKGLYKKQLKPGKHDVTCPRVQEHTEQLDTGACFWEPNPEYPFGGFRCQHSHGETYRMPSFLGDLGLSRTDAKNKPVIRIVAGQFDRVIDAVEEALALDGSFYQFGGAIACVGEDPVTSEPRVEVLTEQSLTRAVARIATWQQFSASIGWYDVDPPVRHMSALFRSQKFPKLPVLKNLARQPFFRPDGTLVSQAGYDQSTGIYASFNQSRYPARDVTRAGAEVALVELQGLIDEFEFNSESDRSAALSAILTAVVRPTLPVAPGFNITASASGSGKSYLADLIAAHATPGQPCKASYPTTSEEATKAILAHLMTGTAVIIFDDMTVDWKAHGAMNRMLTSETIADRLLGVSRVMTIGTRTLVLGTGNNIQPMQDLRRRVITMRLQPRSANPALRSFKGQPVEKVRSQREHFVGCALQIIEAWKAAGSPMSAPFAVASYGRWSELCREPLLWLGQPDPATSLREQLRFDPDAEALGELLQAWHETHADRPITVRKLLAACGSVCSSRITDALSDIPVSDGAGVNRGKLGWFLRKNSGRIVDGYMVQPADSTERNAWQVVPVAPSAPFERGKGGEPDPAP